MATVLGKVRSRLLQGVGEHADTSKVQIADFLERHLYQNPKYQSESYLNRFEFQAFSQSGEDGIIEEIFRRVGITNKFFVEFGVGDGTENNTAYLLHQGWNGLWIEGDPTSVRTIESQYPKSISSGRLRLQSHFISAENIEELLTRGSVPSEFDLLSIDIDRNDYYVWKAITQFRPRVVVIEYNSIFRPGVEFVVDYDAEATWDRTSCFGASLESLTRIAREKDYELVACNFTGINAFFVQRELAERYFEGPFTTTRFYEPPRYFLYTKNGHPRRVSL